MHSAKAHGNADASVAIIKIRLNDFVHTPLQVFLCRTTTGYPGIFFHTEKLRANSDAGVYKPRADISWRN